MKDRDEQQKVNLKHAVDPQRGDYWHEMFCPIRVVLHVTEDTVTFCEKTKQTKPDHWTWDIDKVCRVFKDEFRQGLEYQSVPMKDKFHADVVPGAHVVFADYYRDEVINAKAQAQGRQVEGQAGGGVGCVDVAN